VWIALLRDPPKYKEGSSVLDPRDLLVDNLDVVERAIGYAARRQRFDPSDAEEFSGVVQLRLVENDYAILRAYEGRSSLETYIGAVVVRMALDYSDHLWGKWHPSAEAKRLGALAVDLERLRHRDGRTLEEAVPLLQTKHDGVSPASLQALEAKLPARPPRRRNVSLADDAEETIARPADADADESILAEERHRKSQELSRLISEIMGRLPAEDRLILQLRFEGGMPVVEIARAFKLDQKHTYRRIERNLWAIKGELEGAGFPWSDVADLIGRNEIFVHFDIGNQNARPSMPGDESTGLHTEEP